MIDMCGHEETVRRYGEDVCTECGEILERIKGSRYCDACSTEYEPEAECMCAKYRKRMEQGLNFLVPQWWIREYWDGYTIRRIH